MASLRSAVPGSRNMRFVTEMLFLGIGKVTMLSCGSFAVTGFSLVQRAGGVKAVTASPIMNSKRHTIKIR